MECRWSLLSLMWKGFNNQTLEPQEWYFSSGLCWSWPWRHWCWLYWRFREDYFKVSLNLLSGGVNSIVYKLYRIEKSLIGLDFFPSESFGSNLSLQWSVIRDPESVSDLINSLLFLSIWFERPFLTFWIALSKLGLSNKLRVMQNSNLKMPFLYEYWVF